MQSYSSERHLLLIDWSIFMNGNYSEMAICKKVEHILKVKIALNLILLILWSHQQQWTHLTKCLEWNFWKPHWIPAIYALTLQTKPLSLALTGAGSMLRARSYSRSGLPGPPVLSAPQGLGEEHSGAWLPWYLVCFHSQEPRKCTSWLIWLSPHFPLCICFALGYEPG